MDSLEQSWQQGCVFVMPLALLEKGFTLLPEESVVLFDGTPCGWTDGVFFSFCLALRSFAVTGKFLTSRHPALFDGMSNHDSLRLKLSLPLAGSVKGFECDLVFFITSRSFAVIGKFSILRHLALFERVSNHDGWMSK